MQVLKGLETHVRRLRNLAAPITHAGNAVHCPVCRRSFRKFRPAGTRRTRRENAVCPYCSSRERDRLTYLFLSASAGAPPLGSPLLHIAPERCLMPLLRQMAAGDYVSADLVRRDVSQRFDVMAIPHPDASFHAVYCSHVLQDVRDDQRAMAEIFRVLRPGGWAILNVPVKSAASVDHQEAPGRVRGWADHRPPEHLHTYGEDFPQRMAAAGFRVRVVVANDLVAASEQAKLGIAGAAAGTVNFGVKPV